MRTIYDLVKNYKDIETVRNKNRFVIEHESECEYLGSVFNFEDNNDNEELCYKDFLILDKHNLKRFVALVYGHYKDGTYDFDDEEPLTIYEYEPERQEITKEHIDEINKNRFCYIDGVSFFIVENGQMSSKIIDLKGDKQHIFYIYGGDNYYEVKFNPKNDELNVDRIIHIDKQRGITLKMNDWGY